MGFWSKFLTYRSLAVSKQYIVMPKFVWNMATQWWLYGWVCRSSDMVGVYNRCSDRRPSVICQHWWTWWDGRRASLPVFIHSFLMCMLLLVIVVYQMELIVCLPSFFRSLPAEGLEVWNLLPVHLQCHDHPSASFRRGLKTRLVLLLRIADYIIYGVAVRDYKFMIYIGV